eukprot:Rmarinus@m.12751
MRKYEPSHVKLQVPRLREYSDEVLLEMFRWFTGFDLARSMQVCRRWRKIIRENIDDLYREAIKREFKAGIPFVYSWEKERRPKDIYCTYSKSGDSRLINQISLAVVFAMHRDDDQHKCNTSYSLVDGSIRLVYETTGHNYVAYVVWFLVDAEEAGFGAGTEEGHAVVVSSTKDAMASKTVRKWKKSNYESETMTCYAFTRKNYSKEDMGGDNVGWGGIAWRPEDWAGLRKNFFKGGSEGSQSGKCSLM